MGFSMGFSMGWIEGCTYRGVVSLFEIGQRLVVYGAGFITAGRSRRRWAGRTADSAHQSASVGAVSGAVASIGSIGIASSRQSQIRSRWIQWTGRPVSSNTFSSASNLTARQHTHDFSLMIFFAREEKVALITWGLLLLLKAASARPFIYFVGHETIVSI